jgi:hypothetical protein
MSGDDPDIQWCTTPGCVRPVTFHPGGMHLTEDGREFTGQDPQPRRRLTLITSTTSGDR